MITFLVFDFTVLTCRRFRTFRIRGFRFRVAWCLSAGSACNWIFSKLAGGKMSSKSKKLVFSFRQRVRVFVTKQRTPDKNDWPVRKLFQLKRRSRPQMCQKMLAWIALGPDITASPRPLRSRAQKPIRGAITLVKFWTCHDRSKN